MSVPLPAAYARSRSPAEMSAASATRSRSPELSTGTLTPPSSPGSGAETLTSSTRHPAVWDAHHAQHLDRKHSGDGSHVVRRRRADTKKRTASRAKRTAQGPEPLTLRLHRLFIAVMCYAPFLALWTARGPALDDDLGALSALPVAIALGCAVTAAVKELGQVPALASAYLVLSFAAGLVGGCYSLEGLKDQQGWRLLAVCVHGILAGRLRTLETPTLAPTFMGSHVFWVSVGEVACMLTHKDAWAELAESASSYALILLLVALVATVPTTVMSVWVGVFGQDNPHSAQTQANIFVRVVCAVTWVVSAATPICLALFAAGGFLYFMLPIIWSRMLFVAPWGIMFEFGSAISQSDCSKSMFWQESAINPPRVDLAAAQRSVSPPLPAVRPVSPLY